MPNQMTVRQALKSYGIKLPEPKRQVDPREVEKQMKLKEEQKREVLFQQIWQKTIRGE